VHEEVPKDVPGVGTSVRPISSPELHGTNDGKSTIHKSCPRKGKNCSYYFAFLEGKICQKRGQIPCDNFMSFAFLDVARYENLRCGALEKTPAPVVREALEEHV